MTRRSSSLARPERQLEPDRTDHRALYSSGESVEGFAEQIVLPDDEIEQFRGLWGHGGIWSNNSVAMLAALFRIQFPLTAEAKAALLQGAWRPEMKVSTSEFGFRARWLNDCRFQGVPGRPFRIRLEKVGSSSAARSR